jgi:hypothetical protein
LELFFFPRGSNHVHFRPGITWSGVPIEPDHRSNAPVNLSLQ